MNWMENRGFFDPKGYAISQSNVHFASSKLEKVEKITELDLDFMIDDLIEIFMEPGFPRIGKILFSQKKRRIC